LCAFSLLSFIRSVTCLCDMSSPPQTCKQNSSHSGQDLVKHAASLQLILPYWFRALSHCGVFIFAVDSFNVSQAFRRKLHVKSADVLLQCKQQYEMCMWQCKQLALGTCQNITLRTAGLSNFLSKSMHIHGVEQQCCKLCRLVHRYHRRPSTITFSAALDRTSLLRNSHFGNRNINAHDLTQKQRQ